MKNKYWKPLRKFNNWQKTETGSIVIELYGGMVLALLLLSIMIIIPLMFGK